jgi:hypothetical protein
VGILFAELTPSWSRWFGLRPGTHCPQDLRAQYSANLESAETQIQSHLDRSNFACQLHQAYFELVVLGTACLYLEEAPLGSPTAFHFMNIPMQQLYLDQGQDQKMNHIFRVQKISKAELIKRFPNSKPIESKEADCVEVFSPMQSGCAYHAFLEQEPKILLEHGFYASLPIFIFHWAKLSSENYGRSPIMKLLPDIKTANKVIELNLNNAVLSMGGMWQAEEDGILNPHQIELKPGVIIPKAVGSAGLTPLTMGVRFDLSQLVLTDLRERIQAGLMLHRWRDSNNGPKTATEILERSAEINRLLGATYGRLQTELLTPLLYRAIDILMRRTEIIEFYVNGREVDLFYRSPLSQLQSQQEAKNALLWLQACTQFPVHAQDQVNWKKAVMWIGGLLNVPENLFHVSPEEVECKKQKKR